MLSVAGKLDFYPIDGSPVARISEGRQGLFQLAREVASNPSVNRSIYLPIVRDQIPEVLSVFDFPDASLVNGQRETTNVPSQSLFLLNNPRPSPSQMPSPNASPPPRATPWTSSPTPTSLAFSRAPTTGGAHRHPHFLDALSQTKSRVARATKNRGIRASSPPSPPSAKASSPAPNSATSIDPPPLIPMTTPHPSRRDFLKTTSSGFGYLAFAALAQRQAIQAATGSGSPLAAKSPHFAPRAKHVIFLCMQGAPSHVDLLDYKPKLKTDDGKSAPATAGQERPTQAHGLPVAVQVSMGGAVSWISELLPGVATHADDLCILNSMATDVPAHPQAFSQLHTGTTQFVRPSLGAWALYGLGTTNENLPGFITINPPPTPHAPSAAPSCPPSIKARNSADQVSQGAEPWHAASAWAMTTPASPTSKTAATAPRPSAPSSTSSRHSTRAA
jgi:hypothetical protein